MTFDQLETLITKNAKKISFKVSGDFMAKVAQSPVDSGDLKNAWKQSSINGGYSVSNHLIYAPKIWVGKPGADTWQMPNGLHPIYTLYKQKYVKAMKGVL